MMDVHAWPSLISRRPLCARLPFWCNCHFIIFISNEQLRTHNAHMFYFNARLKIATVIILTFLSHAFNTSQWEWLPGTNYVCFLLRNCVLVWVESRKQQKQQEFETNQAEIIFITEFCITQFSTRTNVCAEIEFSRCTLAQTLTRLLFRRFAMIFGNSKW